MRYFANPSTSAVRDAMDHDLLGCMVTPDQGNRLGPWCWAMDNGCFSDKWEVGKWLGTVARHRYQPRCMFAVVPDVVGDAVATTELWTEWANVVGALGYRCAYVTQNGCTDEFVPWAEMDALFTGGDDAWKLGEPARLLMEKAKRLGKWTHMGRVNTLERLTIAARHGYDSADGTYLAFGPDTNLPKLLAALRTARRLAEHPTLMEAAS